VKPELYKAIFDIDRIFDEAIKAVKSIKFAPICPECGGDEAVKYGKTQYGKQRWKCKNCGVVFTVSSRFHEKLKEIAELEETRVGEEGEEEVEEVEEVEEE